MLVLIAGTGGCKSLVPHRSIAPSLIEQRSRGILLAALAGQNPVLKVHALESLAIIPRLNVIPEMRRCLYDPIPAVRFAGAIAAGDMQDYPSRDFLRRLLQDQNVSVQLAAGYGLEKLGEKEFKDWYDNVLFSNDAKLAGQACMLLGKLGNTPERQDSREKLWYVFRMPNQSAAVQLQAAEALARLGDKSVLKRLLVFASSIYADDRILAISGLQHIGGPDVYAQLTVLAEDIQPEVCLAAIRALGSRAEEDQQKKVRMYLRYQAPDGDRMATRRVRELALLAVGSIGTDRDIRMLYDFMGESSESNYLKVAAARACLDYLKTRRPETLAQHQP